MTLQERIDSNLISSRIRSNMWREATVAEFEHDYPFLENIIRNLNWWEQNSRVAICKCLQGTKVYQLYLFSSRHQYSISVTPEYIGCVATSSYWEPLEDWHRSKDLPDGPATRETFTKILYAILACELVDYTYKSWKNPAEIRGTEANSLEE